MSDLYAVPFQLDKTRSLDVDMDKSLRTFPQLDTNLTDFFVGAEFAQTGELLSVFKSELEGKTVHVMEPVTQNDINVHVEDLTRRLTVAKKIQETLNTLNAWTPEPPVETAPALPAF